jgi:tyrosine-specific transport protein
VNVVINAQTKKIAFSKILSASFLIAGTMIGAGMLGIPMATAQAGFIPACIISILVWSFMLITGILLSEIVLKMPKGSNFLAISEHFFGKPGKYFIGGIFIFLYFCLQIAYIAGGAPLFYDLLFKSSYIPWFGYLIFSSIFALIIFLSTKWIYRINAILSYGMFSFFFIVILIGTPSVNIFNLAQYNFSKMFISVPVLFSAFGYHNVIPTLSDYLEKNRKALFSSLTIGTFISLVIYLLLQQVVLGSVSVDALHDAMKSGKTCIFALQEKVSNSNLYLFSKFFAFFALATSFLGVSLSILDFFKEGFNNFQLKAKNGILCLIIFAPSTFFAILYPSIFSKSLGIAGGVGEAILNGIFPISIVLMGLYYVKRPFIEQRRYYEKKYLFFLFILAFLAIIIEIYDLF